DPLSKNQRTQLEKRIKHIEAEIPTLEEKASTLSAQMAQSDIASNFEKLNAISEEHRETEKRIQELYSEWENAAGQLG
ncbi:MAG: ABC transporter C-terminal domain-containing protein, partial [Pyrinomonadaceae bacterium]